MTGKVWIEDPGVLPVGKMSLLKLNVDGAFVPDGCEWIAPPQDGIEFVEKSAIEIIACPERAGTYTLAVRSNVQRATWIKFRAGGSKRAWDFGWLKLLVPSWSTVRSVLPWLLAFVLIAWIWANRPEPGPTPPVPPGPTPGPPPNPPAPAPIPGDGLRVLIIYEATEGAPLLTPKQTDELYGDTLTAYLNAKCAKGADGKTPEFRIWDKDVPLTNVSESMKAAFSRPRASVPWIIVSNGRTGFEGPLPNGGILELVKRYAP